jgi:hypothetical protein
MAQAPLVSKFFGVDTTQINSTTYNPSGTKYKGNRKGVAAVLDKDRLDMDAAQHEINTGGGSYSFKLFNRDGTEVPNGKVGLPFNGSVRYSDKDGLFTVHDEAYLKEKLKAYEEVEKSIDDVAQYCITSDDLCKRLLGTAMFNKLGPAAENEIYTGDGSGQFDGRPSAIARMHPDSVNYGAGVQKLRAAIRAVGIPIIEGASNSEAMHAGES